MKIDKPALLQAKATDTSQALQQRLQKHTRGQVLFDAASRGRYATDASIYQITPVGVLVPQDDADVKTAIDIARDLHVPVLARGGGTSQCGQTVGASLVIDQSKHLRQLLAFNAEERRATVQPGMVLDHLNAKLKPHGLWYPVDVSTSAQATLGGMAGNNSCGSRSIAYGNMVHNVCGAEVWLADGSVQRLGPVATLHGRAAQIAQFVQGLVRQHAAQINAHWPKVLRRVGGYNLDIFQPQSERPYAADGSVNLAHLWVGAEGTLGFIKTLDLQLAPLPRHKVLGVVNFKSFHAAMDAAQHIVPLGPTAVELVDRTMIELSRNNPAFKPVVEAALIGQPEAILLVEFAGEEQAPLARKLAQLDELIATLGDPHSVVHLSDPAAQKALWDVRKAGLNIMMSLKGDGKPVSFIEDCAVPLRHLAEYTAALTDVFARHGSRGTWYAHASVGTLHVRPILDMRRDGAAKMRAMAEEAAQLVRRFKGAYSGEHGDGLCRGEWVQWQFGPAINEAFRAIKRELDPQGLFAPNRIVDTPKMDDGALFKFPPPQASRPYRTITLQPALNWQAWNVQNDPVTEATTAPGTGGDSTQGLAKAVEMCNNNGHCRQFDAGTMCPSYRVTRDEQHLTRGRANTLRLALSGQLGPDAFTSPEMYATMDLCVGCKGCKRDCPTGVDMARMKIEFLHHYKQRHSHSLKDQLIARLPDYVGLASRLPWLANLRNRVPLLRRLGQRWLGLAAERSLPQFRADTFWAQQRRLNLASREETLRADKALVLLVDTFNGHFESKNAIAAVAVLQHAGYAVHVAQKPGGTLCCGRTYLAAGRVDQAKIKAREMLAALLPFAERGLAIVGLEPSCLFTLRDEMLVMDLGPAAETVAKRAMMFEDFIHHEAQAGRFAPRFKPASAPIVVHGHCHQKAFGAMPPVLAALKLLPGAQPQLIESSCCGMAGSFGYEAAHLQVSMQMAELSLLPALRAAPADAIVVADGTSCRHQIADGLAGQRQALHVARVLQAHLA